MEFIAIHRYSRAFNVHQLEKNTFSGGWAAGAGKHLVAKECPDFFIGSLFSGSLSLYMVKAHRTQDIPPLKKLTISEPKYTSYSSTSHTN